jgi:hypothetical protein
MMPVLYEEQDRPLLSHLSVRFANNTGGECINRIRHARCERIETGYID